jgi:NNP family nitrate/nitrite transporter-like MFS transporter
MGLLTGIVGAAGRLGGFFLPTMLGAMRDATGTYATGLTILSVVFLGGTLVVLQLGTTWTRRSRPEATRQAGRFCYRDLRERDRLRNVSRARES